MHLKSLKNNKDLQRQDNKNYNPKNKNEVKNKNQTKLNFNKKYKNIFNILLFFEKR